MHSEHPEHAKTQKDFQSAIETIKENILRDTEQPSDLKPPFGRANLGKGHIHDLKTDEIDVKWCSSPWRRRNLPVLWAPDGWKNYQEYQPHPKGCKVDEVTVAEPEDIVQYS